MSSTATKRAVATALAGAAIASSLGAPAVSARPVEQYIPGASAGASDSPSVPPPPSSIAASAAEEYEELRSGGAADRPTPSSQPVVDEPSPAGGFDLPSAAIGAATGAGLLIVIVAAGGFARRRPPTRRHGTARA
jgi:hypothetical protein